MEKDIEYCWNLVPTKIPSMTRMLYKSNYDQKKTKRYKKDICMQSKEEKLFDFGQSNQVISMRYNESDAQAHWSRRE